MAARCIRPGGTCLDATLAYIGERWNGSSAPDRSFALYAKLFTIQRSYYDRFTPHISEVSADPVSGRVVFADPDLPSDIAREALVEISAALAEAAPERAEELSRLTDRILTDERNPLRHSSDYSEPGRALLLLVLNPFYEKLASEAIPAMADLDWQLPYCPVCGEYASAAKYALDSGRRFLQCCRCRTQWFRSGTVCTFCDNSDPDMRGYLSETAESPYRAELCDVCSCYIKAVNERVLGREAILHVDSLALVDLDREAVARGYHPRPHSNNEEGN